MHTSAISTRWSSGRYVMACPTAASVSRLSTTLRPLGPANISAASMSTCTPRTLLARMRSSHRFCAIRYIQLSSRVPGCHWSTRDKARIQVSWTRSSPWSKSPVRATAKRLNLGKISTIRVRNSSVTRLPPRGSRPQRVAAAKIPVQLRDCCGPLRMCGRAVPSAGPAALCQGDGHAGLEFGAAYDERCLDAGHVGRSGQLVDDEVLEGCEVRSDAFEEEVGFS